MTAAAATSSSDGDSATSSRAAAAVATSSGSSSDQQRRRQATGTRFQRLKVTSSVAEDQNSELKESEVDNWFKELESLDLGISDFGLFDNRFGFSVFFKTEPIGFTIFTILFIRFF